MKLDSLIKIKRTLFFSVMVLFPLVFIVSKGEISALNNMTSMSSSDIEIVIRKRYPDYRILKYSDLGKGLQEYFGGSPSQSSPGYVTDDFTGDNIIDHAVLLISEKKHSNKLKFVIIIGNKKGSYKWFEIHEWKGELYLGNTYLVRVRPGEVKEYDSMKTRFIKNPGVKLVLYESASRVYYWENKKISYIQTSD